MMSTEQGQFDLQQRSEGTARVLARKWLARLVLLGAACCLLMNTGCQRIYLPRFDPTGANVFLPFPNTTELSLSSTPAFQQPATPPPCLDGGEGGLCNLFNHKLVGHKHNLLSHKSPGKCGEIQLTPLRVVAPVGGEVVLLAGICGEDGYLVKREPLEWMLSPDSVGTFIEVGDDMKSRLISTLRHAPKVEKLDVDFARGRTSNGETLITRGTQRVDDDIQLKDGQTWLSISSPSEGVSRVTVLAPESELWDQRRQTATIYWVDAQWEFPQPQIARSGDAINLLTRVTKAENLKPAAGWTVLYTIVDPSVAVFAPPADPNAVKVSGNSARVTVDANGQANVQITAPPGSRGTTPVVIEVIRPAEPSDNLPEILLGRGQTVVTFSSPGLALQSFGPQAGIVGEQLTYSVTLANPGDIDAENVSLSMNIPAGMQFVTTSLQPTRQTPTQLVWDQGVLPAQRQVDVTIVLQAQQTGDYSVMFRSVGEPRLNAESNVATQIIQPSVDLKFAPAGGVAEAETGSRINFDIDVTNTGRQTLTDLVLMIETDAGLPEAEKGANAVEQRLSMLQPGQTINSGVAFNIQREGALKARIKILSGNSVLAEREATVFGTPIKPKRPGVDVSIEFPEAVTVGSRTRAVITVKNTGETTLTGLSVAINSDPALRAIATDSANIPLIRQEVPGTRLIWTPQDMLAGTYGDTVSLLYVEYEAQSPVAQAAILVQVASRENVQDQAQATTRITASGLQPPPNIGGGGGIAPNTPQERTGALSIALNDLGDPTIVGSVFRYPLTIRNGQNLGDNNIRVRLKVPQGIELVQVSKLTGEPVTFIRNNDTYELQPIEKFLPAGGSIDYIIEARGLVPSNVEMAAAVSSDARPDWVIDTEQTTILPRNQ